MLGNPDVVFDANYWGGLHDRKIAQDVLIARLKLTTEPIDRENLIEQLEKIALTTGETEQYYAGRGKSPLDLEVERLLRADLDSICSCGIILT